MQIREFMHNQINALDIEQLLIAQEFLAALSAEKTKQTTTIITTALS